MAVEEAHSDGEDAEVGVDGGGDSTGWLQHVGIAIPSRAKFIRTACCPASRPFKGKLFDLVECRMQTLICTDLGVDSFGMRNYVMPASSVLPDSLLAT